MALDDIRHPDAERLAEYAEGALAGDARAEVERHLADCPECRAVVMETMEFLEVSDAAGTLSTGKVIPFRRRKALIGVAAALAAAAALVLGVRVVRPELIFGPRTDRPELQELIAAVAKEPTRLVEGRLTGGFKYAPPPSPTRGPGDREISPDVRIAAARIEKLAGLDEEEAKTRGALGVAFLALGDLDRAVDALEEAAQRDGANPSFQVDLSAAYLARAKSQRVAEDWAKALAAADRAIKLSPKSSEALFNKAIALEGLHLKQPALDAWTAYQAVETSSEWANEAAGRVRALKESPGGTSRLDTPAADHQRDREHIEDELLPAWAGAVIAHDAPRSGELLQQAEIAAAQLAAAGGDAMGRDEVRRINQAAARRDIDALNELARGHELYGAARAAYLKDEQRKAADLMLDAAVHFAKVDSPYALWGTIFDAIALRNKGSVSAALVELATFPVSSLPPDYYHLRGRYDWTHGVALDELGRFDVGVVHLTSAVEAFRRAGERDNLTASRTILAEAQWVLGNRAEAWTTVLGVLQDVSLVPTRTNNFHLAVAASFSLGLGLPEASLEFENVRVRAVTSARNKVEAYVRRARILGLLGEVTRAGDDLDHASAAAATLTDPALRERLTADVSIARAELHCELDSKRAVAEASAALEYVPHADPAFRLARLLAVRGRSRELLGDLDGARTDLVASVEAFERKRAGLQSAQDRLRAFDDERPVFKQLVRLESVTRKDPAAALNFAERARAGAWHEAERNRAARIDPSATHLRLPAHVAVVYFEALPDQVLVWVITRERSSTFSRPISLATLTLEVSRIERAIRAGASVDQLRPHSDRLFTELVAPALALAGERTTVFFVPDGPLYSLPFAVLPDGRGRPLLETRTVGIAASFTNFWNASARLAGNIADGDEVVAIGDGHDPVTTGLPPLPAANDEARAVAALYPKASWLTGSSATRRRVLDADPAVLHFAGHTLVNRQFPLFSRLLFAVEPGVDASGAWLASQILEHPFPHTRVVILATCEGAAGTAVDGEGAISVAGAFLAAGVPSVVASLWPVDDAAAGELLVAFHRELRRTRDAPAALRASQLEMIRRHGAGIAIRKWGGFMAFGGAASAG